MNPVVIRRFEGLDTYLPIGLILINRMHHPQEDRLVVPLDLLVRLRKVRYLLQVFHSKTASWRREEFSNKFGTVNGEDELWNFVR